MIIITNSQDKVSEAEDVVKIHEEELGKLGSIEDLRNQKGEINGLIRQNRAKIAQFKVTILIPRQFASSPHQSYRRMKARSTLVSSN